MAEHNNSRLLDGGDDSMGMTDNQYKGMLLDQLEDWQEVLDLAVKAGNTEVLNLDQGESLRKCGLSSFIF